LQPGLWYHVVGTYSQGKSIKTYVNGTLDREQQTLNILAASSGLLKIGCEPFSGELQFNGLMDDLRIYNYPLSDSEVTALYEGKEMSPTAPEILAASGERTGSNNYLILVLLVVIIAAAATTLAIRSKKRKCE
jgi:hypothetical protein